MIKRSAKIFKEFFESEKSGGLILVACTLFSLVLSNSFVSEEYTKIWERTISGLSLSHWINDGLMAIFFLLIGLELKREFQDGELSTLRKASLPIFSAFGGMLVPAGIYLVFNLGSSTVHGFGIPMATDIAFALGILSLMGPRVPLSLKIFLTALAVIDDLGAILVIAFFYTDHISILNLGYASGILALLFIFNKLRINYLFPYLIGGVALWYFIHHSGVHATITGVLMAFVIPSKGSKNGFNPSVFLQRALHYPIPFIILPLFALANTSIVFNGTIKEVISKPHSLGILFGLFIGKAIGITSFSWFATYIKLAHKPAGTSWTQLFGVGLLGGIGFTMSIFVTLLAFDDVPTITSAKISILLASALSGIFGLIWLRRSFKK